jgi:L-seryl-tRNA(Ser) seleniumtransferase
VSTEQFSKLPAVGTLINDPSLALLIDTHGRLLVTEAIRMAISEARENIRAGRTIPQIGAATIQQWIEILNTSSLRDVINGTGVVLHTNLGRAPLALAAQRAVANVARRYSALEFNLDSGQRGSRHDHVRDLLQDLLQAPAAIALNNCAGAVFISLAALCKNREVVIARGELVEIGGGFRVPDIMEQSGAMMVEIGTTNRVHLKDYAQAINENTAAILVVHRSNFALLGFTTQPSIKALGELAREHKIPLIVDVGSGLIADYEVFGDAAQPLREEPRPQDVLQDGADLVTFSGDKLLGGPQAGIIAGASDLLETIKAHPLARAMRADKLTLAALEATLRLYRDGREAEIPVIRDLSASAETLSILGQTLVDQLSECCPSLQIELQVGDSVVGGGALPLVKLPTALVAIRAPDRSAQDLAAQMRRSSPAIIGRISNNQFILDLRTISPLEVDPICIIMSNII